MIQATGASRDRRGPDPIVFAYDFPHRKSQDVIMQLVALGCAPRAVLAAPPAMLRLHPPALRVKVRHVGLLDPSVLCARLNIPYDVVAHAGDECLQQLDYMEQPLVGVVAAARILPPAVLERVARGIVNLHPGLLPATRGLDALQWAIYRDAPLGVTSHLIDHRVDAGWLLERRDIEEYPDDSLLDLSLRLYETQLEMLGTALHRAIDVPRASLEPLGGGSHNRSFPAELVPALKMRFRERRRRLRRGFAAPAVGAAANRRPGAPR